MKSLKDIPEGEKPEIVDICWGKVAIVFAIWQIYVQWDNIIVLF